MKFPKWLSVTLHIIAIAAGVAGSAAVGGPWPVIVTSILNAVMPSPVTGNAANAEGTASGGIGPKV